MTDESDQCLYLWYTSRPDEHRHKCRRSLDHDEKYVHTCACGAYRREEYMPHGFRRALRELLHKHAMENGSDTPDFILTDLVLAMVRTFDFSVNARDDWHRTRRTSTLDKLFSLDSDTLDRVVVAVAEETSKTVRSSYHDETCPVRAQKTALSTCDCWLMEQTRAHVTLVLSTVVRVLAESARGERQ